MHTRKCFTSVLGQRGYDLPNFLVWYNIAANGSYVTGFVYTVTNYSLQKFSGNLFTALVDQGTGSLVPKDRGNIRNGYVVSSSQR